MLSLLTFFRIYKKIGSINISTIVWPPPTPPLHRPTILKKQQTWWVGASLTYIFLEQCEPGIKVKKSGIKVIQQGLASGSRLKVNMFWRNHTKNCCFTCWTKKATICEWMWISTHFRVTRVYFSRTSDLSLTNILIIFNTTCFGSQVWIPTNWRSISVHKRLTTAKYFLKSNAWQYYDKDIFWNEWKFLIVYKSRLRTTQHMRISWLKNDVRHKNTNTNT